MATVFKKGNVWIAQWFQDGRRVKRSTGTDKRREAEKIAAGFEVDDRRADDVKGTKFLQILGRAAADAKARRLTAKRAEEYLAEIRRVIDPAFKIPTVADHLDEWVRAQGARVSASTADGYREMQKAVIPALGRAASLPLPELAHQDAEKVLRALHAGRRAATANIHFRAFRRALQSAVDADLISRNPAKGVKPLAETDSDERAPFDAAEVRAMIDHPETPDDWKGAILFGAHTGLRLGDVVKLGRGHVEGSKLVIRPAKTARKKKTVTIPLTPPLVAWIGKRKGDFFPDLKGAKPGTLSTRFKRIMEKSGVPAAVTLPGEIRAKRSFHSLRHSFASWLAEADIHADVRQKLTGHSSAGVHARYTHHDEALEKAIKALPDLTKASGE